MAGHMTMDDIFIKKDAVFIQRVQRDAPVAMLAAKLVNKIEETVFIVSRSLESPV